MAEVIKALLIVIFIILFRGLLLTIAIENIFNIEVNIIWPIAALLAIGIGGKD